MENIQTKKCTECLSDIPLEAKKCSHCGSKQKVPTPRSVKIILWAIFGGMVLPIVLAGIFSDTSSTTPNIPTQGSFADYESVNVGDDAVLWVQHDPDTRGLVCVSGTQEVYDNVVKSMLAGDYLGITEDPSTFCVGSGTKVKLVEKDFPYRKVRILQGAGEVDNDKVGLSGWTSMEYVVKP
jgi:hypothetical protein